MCSNCQIKQVSAKNLAAGKLAEEYEHAETVDREPSMLMSYIFEQGYALGDLDNALASLVRKLEPVKVELPDTTNAATAQPPTNSQAVNEIMYNTQRTAYLTQLVRALTESIQT